MFVERRDTWRRTLRLCTSNAHCRLVLNGGRNGRRIANVTIQSKTPVDRWGDIATPIILLSGENHSKREKNPCIKTYNLCQSCMAQTSGDKRRRPIVTLQKVYKSEYKRNWTSPKLNFYNFYWMMNTYVVFSIFFGWIHIIQRSKFVNYLKNLLLGH